MEGNSVSPSGVVVPVRGGIASHRHTYSQPLPGEALEGCHLAGVGLLLMRVALHVVSPWPSEAAGLMPIVLRGHFHPGAQDLGLGLSVVSGKDSTRTWAVCLHAGWLASSSF